MGNVCSVSLDNLLICCFDSIVKKPNYAFELEERLALLNKDWEVLKERRNAIKERIEVEERDSSRKRLQEVDRWLLRVDEIETDVDALIGEFSQEIVNKCLVGCCMKNCKTSYKLGKTKVAKMQLQLEVADLLSKGIFITVTDEVSLPPIDKPTWGFESTLDEVWSFIEDEQVGMIGLYGMKGVGKTTILSVVNNKLLNLTTQGYDVVIWIYVSQSPSLSKLQDEIGKRIGFDSDWLQNQSHENKANDIYRVLKEKKFVLLLDDVWQRLDLKNLGVPSFSNQNNKSKVVFTTRSKKVCHRMQANILIEVKCLEWKYAWNLFKKNVGNEALEAHPRLFNVAKAVAQQCHGLPLALITIGRAMAHKTTLQEWDHALNLLKRNTSEFQGMQEDVFSVLKFSYDSLPNMVIRTCFLYCSLYPEAYEIPKKKLIDYWICEGFLGQFNNLREATSEGYDYISTLVHASLLEECSPEKVKMLDVIRDMTIWIACDYGATENNFFVRARAGLREIPNVEIWEGAERVSLMHNEITELTGTPKCPNLLTLFLNNNSCESITSGFFQYMPNLRVLNLSGNYWGTISILREICELVILQYLDISRTGVEELPTEFQNLINLKYLNLSHTKIRIIREGLLSSFKKLQKLKLLGLELELDWGGFLMKELESLEYLNDLGISIESDFNLSNILSSQKLMRIITALTLVQFRGTRYIDMLVLIEMRHLERLDIIRCKSLEEIGMGKGNAGFLNIIKNHNYFPQLRALSISNCQVLKDITWLAFAPNLEDIHIFDCYRMKEVVGGWKWDEEEEDVDLQQIILFANLTTLSLEGLSELETIYPIVLPFPRLKDLKVDRCPKLKKLPLNSSSCSVVRIEGKQEWWNGLEWEDEATRYDFLPSFVPLTDD